MQVKEISVAECKKLCAQGRACLVDVRPHEMAHEPYIEGMHHVPLSELEWADIEPLVSPDKELVFICQRGITSMKAAELVVRQGFKGVCYSVTGGFSEW